METSFGDLRKKEVINVADGKRFGRVNDLVFETRSGKVCGLVVPGDSSFRVFNRGGDDIYVPWENILRIGQDVILVEVYAACGNRGKSAGRPALPGRYEVETREGPREERNEYGGAPYGNGMS